MSADSKKPQEKWQFIGGMSFLIAIATLMMSVSGADEIWGEISFIGFITMFVAFAIANKDNVKKEKVDIIAKEKNIKKKIIYHFMLR